jgi:hypothetical protein
MARAMAEKPPNGKRRPVAGSGAILNLSSNADNYTDIDAFTQRAARVIARRFDVRPSVALIIAEATGLGGAA